MDATRRAGAGAIGHVAVIGTGVIGASWVSRFLASGLNVTASDPAPGAEQALREAVAVHWPSLERMGLAKGASCSRLRFTDDPGEAAAGADFIQESGPERPAIKGAIISSLDQHARPGVVIASSSSGLSPSAMQAHCSHHPERVLVGHPFNPPHLIPLVEVVAGGATLESTVDAAMAFYRRIGKRPIRVHAEIPGYVTNRLQLAMWREAYSLVSLGIATVTDIDTAISNGPGLRWALLGPFATQHLSGGPGGLAHLLEHLGPVMAEWWETLGSPTLDRDLCAKLVAGVDDELREVDQAAMVCDRDALLEGLLAAKAASHNLPDSTKS